MNRSLLTAALTLFLALSPTGAGAHDAVSNTVDFQLYYQELGAFVSRPNETKDQFMTRVGTFLAQYTRTTGWEACGMIQEAKNGSGWAINLTTNGAHIACVHTHYLLEGYMETQEGIHSHPDMDTVRLSRQDSLLGRGTCGGHLTLMPYAFSNPDYDAGPGYLVTPKGMVRPVKLLYQAGKGTERVVANLDSDQPAVVDRHTLTGTIVAKAGITMVPSNLAQETIPWGTRTCKAF